MATPSVMAPADPKPFVGHKGLYKAFAASLTGTALEWYDFAVYSAAAAVVFPHRLLPDIGPLTRAPCWPSPPTPWATFPGPSAASSSAGSVTEIGRKKVLVITLMLIGVATFLIGVLPTYGTIGVARPDHPGPPPLRTGRRRRRRVGRRSAALQRIR